MIFVKAIWEVLSRKGYLLGWLILAILFSFIFISIPVKAIPGNSFLFQLSLLSPKEYLLLASLAFFASLSLVMQFYLWRRKRELKSTMSTLGSGGVGGFAATVASMFGTATCASCISALFGFLGIGTIFTLIDYRSYIVVFSFVFLSISIYFASRRIVGECPLCVAK